MSPTASHLEHLVPSWLYHLGGCGTCRWWSRSLGKTFEDYICACFCLCSPFLVYHGVHSCCDPLSHAFRIFWKSEPRLAFPLRRGLAGVLVTALEKVTHGGISNRRTCLSLWELSLVLDKGKKWWSQCTLEAANALQALCEPRWRHGSFDSFTTEPSC